MTKKIVTKEQLRRMIQERIRECDELDGDCKEVIVNSVYWHEPDGSGSNWDVGFVRNAAGCEAVVSGIVEQFKETYNIDT